MMRFLNPAGLWALLGIPVLVLIYIIKPKFEERRVSSTYIWRLSLKYRKKKVPLQKLNRILLFLMQLTAIAFLSFILAKPVADSENGAPEKVIIIDASASMQADMGTEEGDSSRFARVINEAGNLVGDMGSDGRITLILAADEAEIILERSDSKFALEKSLSLLTCTEGNADIGGAVELAKEILSKNNQAEVVLCTDKDYENTNGIRVINVAREEVNLAVLSFTQEDREQQRYTFVSELVSYGSDATIAAALYIDDEYVDAQMVELKDSEVTEVVWEETLPEGYEKAEIILDTADAMDGDNRMMLFSEDDTVSVYLASETPGFIRTALKANGTYEVAVGTDVSEETLEGYDLYIFDGIAPDSLPSDGSVWLINPLSVPWGVNLAFDEPVTGEVYLEAAPDINTELYNLMTEFPDPEEIAVAEYRKLHSYSGYENMFLCNGDPVILAGMPSDIRTVIFLFDLHNSNLPMLIEFPELVYAIMDYLLTPIVEEDCCQVGEKVQINALSGICTIAVSKDSVTQTYYDFPVEFEFTTPGMYQITEYYEDGTGLQKNIYVRIPEGESDIFRSGGTVGDSLQDVGTVEPGAEEEEYRYPREMWMLFAAILFVLIVIEWGVQYREQS